MRGPLCIRVLALLVIVCFATSAGRAADVKQLAATLSVQSAEERRAAADALADLGYAAQEATPQLVAALTHSDADLRWRAARALGVIGNAQAIGALRKQTTDSEAIVRAQTIFALGRLGASDDESVAAIVERLTDNDAQVRRAGIRALRMIEAPRKVVTPLIVKLLNDQDPTIAMRALSAIAEGGVEVVPALVGALDQKEARYWACLALSEMGPQAKDAAPGLTKVLTDDRPEVRLQATIALGEVGPEGKVGAGALIKLLDDPFESVRTAAVFALGRIGDASATDALLKAEKSTDPVLHMLSTWALAKINKNDAQRMNGAIVGLVRGLGDKNAEIAHMAAKALADLQPDVNVVRPMVDKLALTSPEMADRVMNAFASMGASAVPHALEALKDPQRRIRALRVLARIGADAASAAPALVELLKNGDASTKTEALFTLASIGPGAATAVAPITEALSSDDPQVVQAAGFALGKIGPAAKEAVPALSKLNQSQDELLRMTAVWAILKIGPRTDEMTKSALPILTAALKNRREFVRIEAAMTLGELGPTAASAIPDLQSAASDSSAAVRSAADAAIKKIKG